MREEELIAFAKDVQAGFAFVCEAESVFRTFAVAGEEPFASEAFSGQAVAFVYTELHLLRRVHKRTKVRFENISYPVFFIYEMVAWIQISVVLYDGISSACLCKGARTRLNSAP